MNWRTTLAVGIALILMLPATAVASHMGQYVLYPTSHDLQGSILEPDGHTTTVLGPLLRNCVVDLPPYEGHCGDDAAKTGLGDAIAPGCTGADGDGNPIRRQNGQCGLWTVGLKPQSVPIIPPGTLPAPITEQGMGPGKYPGRYSGSVKFLDASLDQDATQNPGGAGGTNIIALGRYLKDAGIGNWVLPGDNFQWAWYGEYTDRNGNGVVDACFATCHAAMANEFVWYGSCLAFGGAYNPYGIANGFCREDPNPNLQGSHACAPEEPGPCAGTSFEFWEFPGNHHAGIALDQPANQPIFFWALGDLDCVGPPTCDDEDRDIAGDSLLGKQDEVTPDGFMDDRTADNGQDNVGDDTTRQWSGYRGGVGTWYGDDGLLETLVMVTGVNCVSASALPQRFDLGKAPGTSGACTFLDVDKYPTASPAVEALLIGSGADYPNGGLKATARGLWLVVAYGAQVPLPDTDPLNRYLDSVENSQTVYLATQGPLQGTLDDITSHAGFGREPNSRPRTYIDAAGAPHTVSESYVGTAHGTCEDIAVGDVRNPTAGLDLASLEAEFRGWCNTGPGGLGTAYTAYNTPVGRGWIDLNPIRNVVTGTPITITPPCTYCLFGGPSVGIGFAGEPTSPLPEINPAEDHGRALGPGNYFFSSPLGTWREASYDHDESLFPDGAGTTIVTYGPDNWLGQVARTTGQWHYRGFLPISCTTEKDAALASSVHEAAECNPYLDGNVNNPQSYLNIEADGGEWEGVAIGPCAVSGGSTIALAPTDGVMQTQILVVHNYAQGVGPLLPNVGEGLPPIVPYGPGPVDALHIPISCAGGGCFGAHYLVWPTGNDGDDIVTFVTKNVPLSVDLDGDGTNDADTVTDVDYYPRWYGTSTL